MGPVSPSTEEHVEHPLVRWAFVCRSHGLQRVVETRLLSFTLSFLIIKFVTGNIIEAGQPTRQYGQYAVRMGLNIRQDRDSLWWSNVQVHCWEHQRTKWRIFQCVDCWRICPSSVEHQMCWMFSEALSLKEWTAAPIYNCRSPSLCVLSLFATCMGQNPGYLGKPQKSLVNGC